MEANMTEPKYLDVNQDFFRQCFERALPYDAYLAAGEEKHRAKWEGACGWTAVAEAERALLASFTRKMNVLCLSGIWCGDCVRQGPILQHIAEACKVIDLRFVDRDQEAELARMLRINGATKVPVVVFLSEDFFEIAREGDRTLSVYRRKAVKELGPSCDTGLVPPNENALAAEMVEWVNAAERAQLILRMSPMLRERYGD